MTTTHGYTDNKEKVLKQLKRAEGQVHGVARVVEEDTYCIAPARVRRAGFTIVELLIVIVVIGILAAITIIAYNGIQARAQAAAITSDLHSMAKSIVTEAQVRGAPINSPWFTDSQRPLHTINTSAYATDTNTPYNWAFCANADGSKWYISTKAKSGKKYKVDQSGTVVEYPADTTDDGLTETGSTPTYGESCTAFMDDARRIYCGYNQTDTTNGPWRSWVGGNA